MSQEYSFPSLDDVLDKYLDGFPREKLLAEDVETVRPVLWELVEDEECLTTIQYMVVWCEYARNVQLQENSTYFGLDKATFAQLSREEMIHLSLNGLDNGLQEHRKVMKLWKQVCNQVEGQPTEEQEGAITDEPRESNDEQPEENNVTDEPQESEEEQVSSSPPKTKRGRPRKRSLRAAGHEEVPTSPPRKRKRGRPRKHPLPEAEAEEDSTALPPKRKRGRPRKHPLRESASGEESVSPPPRRKRGRPSRRHSEAVVVTPHKERATTQPSVDEEEDTSPTRMSTRRVAKPKRRFDPCSGHGRHWSEPGQLSLRKIPQHALMGSTMKKKKTNRIFNIENRGMTPGVFEPKSLWKYVCPKDSRAYIVEVANGKGVSAKDGKIEVPWKGYGSKKHRLYAHKLQVPTDEDFKTFEANLMYARQIANASVSRRYGKA